MSSNKLIKSNDTELIEEISTQLTESGLSVNPLVTKLVIEQYLKTKVGLLLEGTSVDELGIGVTSLSWRRLPSAFSDKGYTSKLKLDMDKDFKKLADDVVKSSVEDSNNVK